MSTPPELKDDLVAGCLKGDRKAQYRFYRKYARSLFNVSMRIVNHSGDAEDILQESFIDAFEGLKDFRKGSSLGAWLKRIVINNSINWLKRRRLSLVEPDELELPVAEEEEDWEGIDLQVSRVLDGIRRLPDGYRVVLSLHLLEGYDHGEIAEILQINEASSRSQYLRARRKLLEILKCGQYERRQA